MRIILYTGKGGVGKTTLSAATALRAASLGYRTLAISVDPAHSLSDSFEMDISGDPRQIGENLWGQEIVGQREVERNASVIMDFLKDFLSAAGMDEVVAEEIAVLPGMDEFYSLLAIRDYSRKKSFDVCIVDCAPSGSTLRLLSMPEVLNFYLRTIFPLQRTAVRIARPVAKSILKVPLPADNVFESIKTFYTQIGEMKDILTKPRSTIRLVMNAEKMVIEESQRTYTYLCLFGFNVDAVVVNRILPPLLREEYFEEWKRIQQVHLGTIREIFSPLPISEVPLKSTEVRGMKALAELAGSLYGENDPVQVLYKGRPFSIRKRGRATILSIELPFVSHDDLALSQKGDELIISVGGMKKVMVLPSRLEGKKVEGAKFNGNTLEIEFRGE
ncbi:MAG: ArsA family ATPase [Candidatus Eremiobacteraeota bacterium]|nr:ArsA family ATPase [Candidatus Eremiobacteraeota bacterium]